jgi:hypothetical protein
LFTITNLDYPSDKLSFTITEGSGQGAIAGGKSKSATTFRPQDAVNRGTIAQFMKRLARVVDKA